MSTTLTPYRRNPVFMDPFRTEMADLFEKFFGDSELVPAAKSWTPRVDVEETDKEILVKADLPGVDPKNVEISIENGVLTIRGERREEKEDKKKNYHRLERFAGSFYRAVPLPPAADADNVTATSANGVVTVAIPKRAEAMPKKITVTPKA